MPRLSTEQYFSFGITQYQQIQKKNLQIRNQIGSGERIQTGREDPLARAAALGAKRDLEGVQQYNRNILFLRNRLSEMESSLENSSETMRTIKENFITGGKGILSLVDREILAQELEGKRNELMSIANRSDATGKRLFSGIREDQAAFDQAGVYQGARAGDVNGQNPTRAVEISAGRRVNQGVTGENAFTFRNPDNANQEESIFQVIDEAITLLRDQNNLAITDEMAIILSKSDRIYDQMQIARTSLGTRLREIETVELINTDASIELEQLIGQNIGADLADSISQLQINQAQEAAFQRTYSSLAGRSLFDFIGR